MAKIRGTSGPDHLIGSKNGDEIRGGGGDDLIEGREGNDVLFGGAGIDHMYGGSGNDSLYGDTDGATGADSLSDYLYGEGGDDLLGGQGGDDFLFGGSGNDKLFGDQGDDSIAGDSGQDVFEDFWGRDIHYGGAWGGGGDGERDTFRYDFVGGSSVTYGIDLLADFESGIDVIDLSSFDANVNTPISQPRRGPITGKESFVLVEEASGTAGELTLTYDPVTNITTLRTYTNNDFEAELTIEIVGTVNPQTDILGLIPPV